MVLLVITWGSSENQSRGSGFAEWRESSRNTESGQAQEFQNESRFTRASTVRFVDYRLQTFPAHLQVQAQIFC